jgi:transcriptional regulator with XRE-family HTH domain
VYADAILSTTQTKRRRNVVTGRKLELLRRSQGLSPEQLGYRIGVSGRTIRRVEQGMVPIVSTMFALAQWAEEDVNDLWRL